jgi:hypothetical protein
MKIKKILPLLAIAVVALFALSSCDQMLEAIYPNETTPPSSTNNAISLSVYTTQSALWTASGFTATIYDGKLRVEVRDSNGVVVETGSTSQYNSGYDVVDAYWYFSGLKDGTYYVHAWIDQNGDGLENDAWYYKASYSGSSLVVSSGSTYDAYLYIPN